MSWYADPGSGLSILAYCGGGGSAKTGVHNSIVILENDLGQHVISTGDDVGVALKVYKNPVSNKLWLVVALGKKVQRFTMPAGELDGTVTISHPINALAVHPLADQIALGDETGAVHVFSMTDDSFDDNNLLGILETHKKTVCSLAFSLRANRLITSAKDGTACIYQNGQLISGFKCSVEDTVATANNKKSAASNQVLVRGCAFADVVGKVAITVTSARRGTAVLAKWQEDRQAGFQCVDRNVCSANPISAMSLSDDGLLLALGSVDGTIILWSMEQWKPIKTWPEVHDLPVTCIAVRPFPVPLQGEDDGVRIHARSASADSQLGCLTLQRRAPKKASKALGVVEVMAWINRLLAILVLAYCLSPIWEETKTKCGKIKGFEAWRRCVIDEALIAPIDRPGVKTPPY